MYGGPDEIHGNKVIPQGSLMGYFYPGKLENETNGDIPNVSSVV